MKALFICLSGLLFLTLPQVLLAQGDGPRTYVLVPEDTQMLTGFYFNLEGNQAADPALVVPDGELDVQLLVSMYTRTFEFNGKQGAFFGILPVGDIDGTLSAFDRSLSGSTSGVGDATLGAILGVYNSPNLSLREYATREVTPNAGLLAKLTLPTGRYDEDKSLNLGSNRWSLQLGLPMAYYLGSSMVDPRLTSFELLPSVSIFSDNNDPGGDLSSTSQDVLYKLEAHITHNLNQSLWISLDVEKTYGGETSANDEGNDDRQNSLGLGCTINYSFSSSTFVKATYGRHVQSNSSGADGELFRIQLSYLF